MNNSLKVLLGTALLSTIMIGCENTQTRDGQISASSMNATECDSEMKGKMDCDTKDKMDCDMKDKKKGKMDCDKEGKKMAACPTSKAKADCDSMKKEMD